MELEALISKDMPLILKIQSTAIKALTDFLDEKEFLQMMPVILSPITDPLCHSVYDAKIKYLDQDLQLTKSMILHKQLSLISEGISQIYIMSPNVRLEKADCESSGRHLIEFSQLDIEIKHATKKDFLKLAEDMVTYAITKVKEKNSKELEQLGRKLQIPKIPFKVYDSKDFKESINDAEKRLSKEATEPFWILNHKREFYDMEDKTEKGYYHNYDLIWPEGFGEALSGAEREFEFKEIVRKMKERGMNLEDYESYLNVASKKLLKPSAGGGLGIERFVRYLAGKRHISEISPFAKVPGRKITF
ncbi:MAG: asparagine synthetase A [Nanoarchaeota archaeon]|nr:asparagine synthetase A [Nanoarchaeota archaeon]